MLETVREDLRHKAARRGLAPSLASIARISMSEGTLTQILYRATRFCEGRGMGILGFFFYRLNAAACHAVIGRGADIGPGLVILHGGGIVINTHVRAGKNLVLEHAVTLGEAHGRSPSLGDNVYIGAGAKVLGPVRVGSNVSIGANAVVTRDLPDGATAVGVPARVVKMHGKPVSRRERGRA